MERDRAEHAALGVGALWQQPVNIRQISDLARRGVAVHLLGHAADDDDLKVIQGHPLLVKAALEAVQRWRYQPTLLNGDPVEVVTEIDVNYTLAE